MIIDCHKWFCNRRDFESQGAVFANVCVFFPYKKRWVVLWSCFGMHFGHTLFAEFLISRPVTHFYWTIVSGLAIELEHIPLSRITPDQNLNYLSWHYLDTNHYRHAYFIFPPPEISLKFSLLSCIIFAITLICYSV